MHNANIKCQSKLAMGSTNSVTIDIMFAKRVNITSKTKGRRRVTNKRRSPRRGRDKGGRAIGRTLMGTARAGRQR
jgi:hypothetical protein